MNDERTHPEAGAPEKESEEDQVARILRLAGPRARVPEERAGRVRERVLSHWRASIARDRRRARARWIAAAAAAAAGLLVLIGAGLRLRDARRAGEPIGAIERIAGEVRLSAGPAAPGGALSAAMVLSTGPGGMAAIRLAGGPSLRVGVLTELTFSAARVVDLRHGDLYIDSGAGPAGGALPIEIRTPLGRVRDVGTQFALRLTDDALVVSVREGSAVLARAGRTYTAGAGTRLRAPASGAVETGTVAPRGSEWDWALGVAPPFEMEGRTLRDYIAWLSRETGWRVEFADPAAAPAALAVVLHGSTSGLRPDETPDAVLPACGLTYRRDGGTLLIESAGAGRHG